MTLEDSIKVHIQELKDAIMGDIALMVHHVVDESEISKELDRVIAAVISNWRCRFELIGSGGIGVRFSHDENFDDSTLTIPLDRFNLASGLTVEEDAASLVSAIDAAIAKLEIYRGQIASSTDTED